MLITLLVISSMVLLFVMDDDTKEMVLNEYYRNEYTMYQNNKHRDIF